MEPWTCRNFRCTIKNNIHPALFLSEFLLKEMFVLTAAHHNTFYPVNFATGTGSNNFRCSHLYLLYCINCWNWRWCQTASNIWIVKAMQPTLYLSLYLFFMYRYHLKHICSFPLAHRPKGVLLATNVIQ